MCVELEIFVVVLCWNSTSYNVPFFQQVVKYLTECSIKQNRKDIYGNTPLMYACLNGYQEIAAILLQVRGSLLLFFHLFFYPFCLNSHEPIPHFSWLQGLRLKIFVFILLKLASHIWKLQKHGVCLNKQVVFSRCLLRLCWREGTEVCISSLKSEGRNMWK